MASGIGTKLYIDGERDFKDALRDINKSMDVLSSEMKLVSAQFDKSDKSEEALTARSQTLTKEVETQKEKIEALQKALQNAQEGFGENDKRTQNWQIQLNNAQAELVGMEKELSATNKELEDMAAKEAEAAKAAEEAAKSLNAPKEAVSHLQKIGDALDAWKEKSEAAKDKMTGLTGVKNDFSKLKDAVEACKEKHFVLSGAMEKIGDASKKAGEAVKSGLSSALKGLGTGLEASAKAAGVALAAISGAAIKLGKEVVEGFAELEQNLGGSEAVFGKYAASIQKVGEDAYKNMGVTQSEYLATANKMGALLQGAGLDQERSLQMTEKAMQRAADMASVMGIETSAALEAVTGAAKGNFTMMDNLGVKMDATTLAAYAVEKGFDTAYNKMSSTEKTELAMQYFFENTKQYAGNFANEATETISGSFGMLKASVSSLIAGLGNSDADIQNLTNNVIDAFSHVVENVTPVLQNLTSALPEVMKTGMLALSETLLPSILDTLTQLIASVAEVAPLIVQALITGISSNLGSLATSALMIIKSLADGLLNGGNLKHILTAAVSILLKLVSFISNNINIIIDAAVTIIKTLSMTLLQPDVIINLVQAAIDILLKITTALLNNMPTLINVVFTIIEAVAKAFLSYNWIDIGKNVILGILNGLNALMERLGEALRNIGRMMIDAIKNVLGVHSPSTVFADIGRNLLEGLWEGIENVKDWLIGKLRGLGSAITDALKAVFDINSPSKVFENEIGKNLGLGIGVGFEKVMGDVREDMAAAIPTDFDLDASLNMPGTLVGRNTAAGPAAQTYSDSSRSIVFNVSFNISDFHNHRTEDIEDLTREVSETMAAMIRREQGAFA